MGIRLERYLIAERQRLPAGKAKEVVNLGVAGMLHDTGKTQLPPALQKYNEVNLPPDEHRQEWEQHVRHGYEIVHKGVEPSAAAAVLHHHQRWDGTGFPKNSADGRNALGLEAKKAHVFAHHSRGRIFTIGSRYRSRCERTNVEIHHLLRTSYAASIDPEIRRAMELVAPPYPPGTRIVLSDGNGAMVVKVDAVDPLLPGRVHSPPLAAGNHRGDPLDLKSPVMRGIDQVEGQPVKTFLPENELNSTNRIPLTSVSR